MKNIRTLTPKQALFVQEYLVDLNATQAAIRAGYSKRTAKSAGQRLLTNVDTAKAISKAQEKRSERTEIEQDRVLEEYAKLAFLDPRRFFDGYGTLIPIQELDADVAAAITGLEVKRSFNKHNETFDILIKIKFADKKAALDSVARHLGMFVDRLEVGGDLGINVNDMSEERKAELKELAQLRSLIELQKRRDGSTG
jgi:phage terminase small subunit